MSLPPRLDWPSAGIGPGLDVPVERRVTRDNWRLYPFTRWAFQHARELVPSRALPRTAAPRPLAAAPVDLGRLAFDDGAGRRIDWAGFLEAGFHDALLVLHRGRLVHEHYANGMTGATPHMAFSITKSIVGLVAERSIADGALDPLVPVDALVPELAASGFAGVPLRHLLDMTDGVAFDEGYADPDAQVHRYSAAYWTPRAGHDGVLGALPGLVRRAAEPGAAFGYRTPVADAVGHALRRATGRRLAELVADHVWTPAGCGDEAYMLVDTAGTEISGTGLNATARDLARVALWLLDDAQQDLLAALLAGGDRALFAAAMRGERENGSYRSLWWIDHADPPTLTANGVYGQRLWIDPTNALAVLCLGSHPVPSNSLTDALHRHAFRAVRRALP